MEKLIIFDTTLRDGEQAPGATMNEREKLEVARQLVALGVDVIEAGFPISSKGDFNAVKRIASSVKGAIICALSRAMTKDIDAAYQATRSAKGGSRIHVFLATSKIHMQYKLKKAEDEILRLAVDAVKYAKKYTKDIEFSPEDASRTEPEFLFKVVSAVIAAGATTVNIPDTVGYAYPAEYGALIRAIRENVDNINNAVISVHCHNDLGLAVANSLEAVRNGARQVECTINGIGERAGNASLEEIVMAIRTRRDVYPNADTNINSKEIYKASRLVSKLTGFVVAPNKAIVGLNAFRHESGIHQDGVIKKAQTYEIISPADVGFIGTGLVLGKHSGRHALERRLSEMGITLSEKELAAAFEKFKNLADKKKTIYEEDLVSLVENEINKPLEIWQFESVSYASGTNVTPSATARLRSKGKAFSSFSKGDGPVDACYKAIEKITKIKTKLLDYRIEAVTSGKDALGEVSVKVASGKKATTGRGSSTDIIEASAKAFVNAVNKLALNTGNPAAAGKPQL
ncbi:MAG: 2-isopropylmalate synthase [Candidatus Omnitrophica bacterium CG1_02_44_16]|nr:MAG: 2-isopropylmalate synthase [Candidatus Omnitrophica bacterium CG1_02_44_16]PIY83939.1 MAG: 2-isopropylmalate synthase [Candidatus Omnitrophica bacterium CG_4_10_14_0_8_um_filter_44_12]PIZ85155.1 MAG: 2-isopropylmalate synthase [Candidatus Omnitrophica bacterium CG_4_10_14_0_2_um_filter_44_9]